MISLILFLSILLLLNNTNKVNSIQIITSSRKLLSQRFLTTTINNNNNNNKRKQNTSPPKTSSPTTPIIPPCSPNTNITIPFPYPTTYCGLNFNGGRKFLGIPYAKPPINELRFAPPQLLTPPPPPISPYEDDDAIPATLFSPSCPQLHKSNRYLNTFIQSEDCLTLNIFIPQSVFFHVKLALKPVLVYLPGFQFSRSNTPDVNGQNLVTFTDVIVVTLNSRLGSLGFYSFPGSSGNLGILDQQMALQFIVKNIQAFGGDPLRITLFGDGTGGSQAVGLHLLSIPSSAKLFQNAIMESNPLAILFPTKSEILGDRLTLFNSALCQVLSSTTTSSSSSLAVLLSSSCQTNPNQQLSLEELKQIPFSIFLQAEVIFQSIAPAQLISQHGLSGLLPWTPYIDGKLISSQPFKGFGVGIPIKPVLFGWNQNDSISFMNSINIPATMTLATLFSPVKSKNINERATTTTTITTKQSHPLLTNILLNDPNIIQDILYRCGNMIWGRNLRYFYKKAPFYAYEFLSSPQTGYVVTDITSPIECGEIARELVCSVAEKPFVWGNLVYVYPKGVPLNLSRLQSQIVQLWTNFAKYGELTTKHDDWPLFDGTHAFQLGYSSGNHYEQQQGNTDESSNDIWQNANCATWKSILDS
jgi:carboxylesterase type B